jgi:hypothetical protein
MVQQLSWLWAPAQQQLLWSQQQRQLRQQSDTSALRPSCCCCAILSRSGRDTLMQACKQLFCVACNACKPSMHVYAHEDHQQSNIEKGYTKRQLQPNGSSPPT